MKSDGSRLHNGESWTGSSANPKEIPTVPTTAKYTGDHKAVTAQAQTKIPNNPDEVIAKNTKQKICSGCSCCK